MAGTVIHADDTPVPVLAPGNGKTKTGRLWIYLRELYESAEGKPANVTEVACWAHVRRKFFDVHKANGSAIAREALERIGALFDIERTIAASLQTDAGPCARAWPGRSSTSSPDGSTSS